MDKLSLINQIDLAADYAYMANSELFTWLIDIKQAILNNKPIPIDEEKVELLLNFIPKKKERTGKTETKPSKPRELTAEELQLQRHMREQQKERDKIWNLVYESMQDEEYVNHVLKECLKK